MAKINFEKLEELDYRSNESYKSLRTNIQFSGSDVKTILFTSSTVNEGKSSVVFNLARAFAENGNRILLIDADLRKSVLVGRYKIGEEVIGLSYYLSGQNELQEIVNTTSIENMDMILAGKVPPNPSELLGNERFRTMITMLNQHYDYILIDSPPLGMVIDSAVIAPCCDGVILVIENNTTSRRVLQEVKEQLEKTNCRILGAVLNKVEVNHRGKYGGGYYGGNYGKYYGDYYGT
jgi:capsular exopolysaccharide synthesis family protein